MTRADMLKALQNVPLFADVDEAALKAVVATARHVVKTKGERLFEEGSAAAHCFVLTSGRAKVVLSGAHGEEVILGLLEPGALTGEIALLDGSTRSAGIVVLEHSDFIAIARESFLALRDNRRFEDRLMAHVTSTLRRATKQLLAIYTEDAAGLVGSCLARLALQRGKRSGRNILLSPSPPHHQLADMAGVARETVTKILQKFRGTKVLSGGRKAWLLPPEFFDLFPGDSAGRAL